MSVSIVLPTFNRLAFLCAAIESVFAQTFADWTLIIADDGSDEPVRGYLRTLLKDPRIEILWLPHTGNAGVARNAALRVANREYVAFLDSDDLWQPSKLERQIASLRSSNICRWGYTGYDRVGINGETIFTDAKPMAPHRGAIFSKLLTLEAEVSTPTVIAERRLLAQAGGFDENLLLWEDYDLWLRLACLSEVDLIDEPLTRLRSHEEHYSTSGVRNQLDRLTMLKKAQRLHTDVEARLVADGLIARQTVDLARLYASRDKAAALTTLARGFKQSWRSRDWWSGISLVLLKVLMPNVLIVLFRRGRAAIRQNRAAAVIKSRDVAV